MPTRDVEQPGQARYLLMKLLARAEPALVAEHRWVWEGDRWRELVYAILFMAGDSPVPDARQAVQTLDDVGLLEVSTLAAIAVADADDVDARHLRELLAEAGFDEQGVERAVRALHQVARRLQDGFDGKIQLYLREHATNLLARLADDFPLPGFTDEIGRQVFTFWLQNALGMPLSLLDETVLAFCADNRITPEDLVAAADDLDLNLALLDDVVHHHMGLRRAAEALEASTEGDMSRRWLVDRWDDADRALAGNKSSWINSLQEKERVARRQGDTWSARGARVAGALVYAVHPDSVGGAAVEVVTTVAPVGRLLRFPVRSVASLVRRLNAYRKVRSAGERALLTAASEGTVVLTGSGTRRVARTSSGVEVLVPQPQPGRLQSAKRLAGRSLERAQPGMDKLEQGWDMAVKLPDWYYDSRLGGIRFLSPENVVGGTQAVLDAAAYSVVSEQATRPQPLPAAPPGRGATPVARASTRRQIAAAGAVAATTRGSSPPALARRTAAAARHHRPASSKPQGTSDAVERLRRTRASAAALRTNRTGQTVAASRQPATAAAEAIARRRQPATMTQQQRQVARVVGAADPATQLVASLAHRRQPSPMTARQRLMARAAARPDAATGLVADLVRRRGTPSMTARQRLAADAVVRPNAAEAVARGLAGRSGAHRR